MYVCPKQEKRKRVRCPFCKHEFTPNVDDPKECPKCKRYFTPEHRLILVRCGK